MKNSLLMSQSFINGQWVDAIDHETFQVLSPANETKIMDVSDCTTTDAENAVQVAHTAFQTFKKSTASERSQYLRAWFNRLIENQEQLAEIITLESGKPLQESRAEVSYAASFVEWFSEEARRTNGEVLALDGTDRRLMTIKQGVGVCSAITPWNFPLAMITRKCAPAIAAGCTLVIKPSELTPLTALACAQLVSESGIPEGVFNVITSSRSDAIGKVFSMHPLVRKVSFTGSTPVGKRLLQQSANTVKRVSMELGGNAPFIVFDDADLEKAIEGAMASKYRNAGQTCVCSNRFLVQAGIYDAFAKAITSKSQQLKLGNGLDQGVDQGPLISRKAYDKVDRLVQDAIGEGAIILTGAKGHSLGGNFYEPTVLGAVSEDMQIFHEEIFGPVVTLCKFDTEEEALTMANNTPYGLAAYCYTQDAGRMWRVSEGLEYGMVGINEGIISSAQAPFGGVKESGLGREGSLYGIDEYLEIKYLCFGGIR